MNTFLSFSSLRLDRFSKEGNHLKSASGFIVKTGNQYYLITNWHVVSGRDFFTRELLESDVEPATLQISLHVHLVGENEKIAPISLGHWKKLSIELYNYDLTPKWIEYQSNKKHHPTIDVVALSLESNLRLFNDAPSVLTFIHRKPLDYWSEISSMPMSIIDTDVEYCPSDTVSVIGHPLGWAPTGPQKSAPAFWRRSAVASEIKGVAIIPRDAFFIDPCSPEGMTGSPVIGMKDDRPKLLGVYSDSSTAGFGANAGLVWNASVVKNLIGTST
jgi:hypothetical protein